MKGLPEDKRAELFKLVLEGKLSFGQIALKFGISRSAAIGLCHRANVKSPRPKSHNQRPSSEPKLKPKPQNKATVVQVRTAKFIAVEPSAKWEDFNSPHAVCWECFDSLNHCHWPIRDEPFQFCGHPKPPDKAISYCEYHTKKAHKVKV